MNIATALNNSRNIPAIKMFFMAGWEKAIVNLMNKLWVDSLKHHGQYGAPLALGTWEMTPLELASAYSVYANMWEKKDIVSILKIVDWKWNIIEEYKETKWEQVILKEQAYINNTMLSNTSTRPTFWNTYLSLNDRKLAAKTWTSTKQYIKNWKKDIYPANLWTIWYTPNYTTVVWAWNTDWEKLNYKWNWLEWAWPIMKEYMDFAHKWIWVESWKEPAWINKINISEISWLLPNPENESSNYLTESLFLNKPDKYDDSFRRIEVDVLCNWKVSDKTPEAAIKKMTLVQLHSLYSSNSKWEDPVIEWSKSEAFKEKYWNIPNIITQISSEECARSWIPSNILIKANITENETFSKWENYIEFAYNSNNPLIKAEILINDVVIDEIDLNNKLKWAYLWNFNIPANYINQKVYFSIRALDSEYYSSSSEKTKIIILEKDIIAPIIELENPINWSIKLYEDTFFNLKANIIDRSSIRTMTIRLDWKTIKTWLTDKKLSYSINTEKNISVWKHIIEIEVIDKSFNKTNKEVKLEILAR
jgi:membrane carboxypeptidase/penicillin-binding protein PbpC